MRHTVIRLTLLLGLLCTLTACGFALRGAAQGGLPFTSVQLQAAQANAAFLQQLRTTLNANQISTINGQSPYTLRIGPEQSDTRTASVNGRARAAQYDLQLAVEVSLERDGTALFGPQVLSAQRSYFEDIANIAGSTEEMEMLRVEMRQDLVQQLLSRLRAIGSN